ncbi:MAG: hypothetical protein AAFY21_14820, partial [Cyanobacteria bacterium J06641_2]
MSRLYEQDADKVCIETSVRLLLLWILFCDLITHSTFFGSAGYVNATAFLLPLPGFIFFCV